MYPFIRMTLEAIKQRNAGPLEIGETHVSHHLCWPWDIDPWLELNNGRTLTLYDLGRIPMARRLGLASAARKRGWGMAVAGVSVRYRRRVRTFQLVEMRSRVIGWDKRFFYLEQSMWREQECLNHMLLRSAVTGANGIVPPVDVAAAMGRKADSPALPDWVQAWIHAEGQRPWPPE